MHRLLTIIKIIKKYDKTIIVKVFDAIEHISINSNSVVVKVHHSNATFRSETNTTRCVQLVVHVSRIPEDPHYLSRGADHLDPVVLRVGYHNVTHVVADDALRPVKLQRAVAHLAEDFRLHA